MVKGDKGYQAHKERVRARETEQSRSGRDLCASIGKIPPPTDPARRRRASGSLLAYLETYHAADFSLEWSRDQLQSIAKVEQVILNGGRLAEAAPRGDGKTTRLERAELWAALNGHRKYPLFIAAEAGASEESIRTIKAELESNELLAADYPEICIPCAALEGIAQRAAGQLYNGKRTGISWGASKIILPTLRLPEWVEDDSLRPFVTADGYAVGAGAILDVVSILSRIRGRKHKLATGGTVRPDMFILDDIQTERTAWSDNEVSKRIKIIQNAVLRLAGPDKEIAGFASVTVIRRDDAADQLLDRKKNPKWQGVRRKMMLSPPLNLALWDEYDRIMREEMRAKADDADADKRGTPLADAYYTERRCNPECADKLDEPRQCDTCDRKGVCMDAGAVITWKARHPDCLSAVQYAMNLRLENEDGFMAECQNEPKDAVQDETALTADQIAERVNRHKRGIVPAWATRLTAFVDVQDRCMFYTVAAWSDDFTGAVIDYGTYPDQQRPQFTARDCPRTIARAHPSAGLEGRIHAGLEQTVNLLCGREWTRDDGANLRLERCLIDANWGQSTDVVYAFCRSSEHAAVLLPSHGRYIGASSAPFSQWQARPGERMGLNWALRSNPVKRVVRHVVFDTNFWKSFIQARLAMAIGDKGAITLFGDKPHLHRLFAEHLTAEYKVRTEGRGRTVDEWQAKPNRPDNHWLDCLVGCAVAASVCGCALPGSKSVKRAVASGKSWSQLAREKRMRQA